MTDYTEAPFWAISSIGYGRGFTPHEALDNYVDVQVKNYPLEYVKFDTVVEFKQALRSGEASPEIWKIPEGFDGFVLGMGAHWTRSEGPSQEFKSEDRVLCPVCATAVAHHVANTYRTEQCVL